MRKIIFLTFLFISHPAHAQGYDVDSAPRLEIGPTANVVSVIIDGTTVAQFTSGGLMIHGNVKYTGTLEKTEHVQVKPDDESGELSGDVSNAP